jgi:protein-disulfide isomerase
VKKLYLIWGIILCTTFIIYRVLNMGEEQKLTKKERKELKRKEKEADLVLDSQKTKSKKYFGLSMVLLAVFVIFGIWWISKQVPETLPISSEDVLQVQDNDWIRGNKESDIVLIEYLDFECTACAAYNPLVNRIYEEYGDRVLFVTRYFPLTGYKNSFTSATAVESAGKQGKFWEMGDLLFDRRSEWGGLSSANQGIFEKYAEQLNLDMELFKQDVKSQEVKNRIISDRNSGNKIGLNAVPTFFLNGKKIENPRGYEAFKFVLDNVISNVDKEEVE